MGSNPRALGRRRFFHNVATDLERNADFSLSQKQAGRSGYGQRPFPNNVIPQRRAGTPLLPNYLRSADSERANLINTRGDGTVFGRIAFNRARTTRTATSTSRASRPSDQRIQSTRDVPHLFHNIDDQFSHRRTFRR